jgi:TonB-linked SusC/RagA family outer membrane protein
MVTGKVTGDDGAPLAGASVVVKGTNISALTNNEGNYSIRAVAGQVLQFAFIGAAAQERTIGTADVINVQLRREAITLDALVVTALGQTASQRALGTSQQTVRGTAIAQTQRENFVNSLQGRVAGVEVTSTSGVPGASSSIIIRGVSSISSSNQPLFIIDGLPVDNKTFNTNSLASATSSATDFANRGLDFTNRAADFNPEDIETLTVLKGPEAAALYGIDAANGAIVITTKRGRDGTGGLEYSNSFRVESLRGRPEIQRVYGASNQETNLFSYFGTPYPEGTQFYDNISGFFQTALTQRHNLSFSGAAGDGRIGYRLSGATTQQKGVVPNARYDKINLSAATQAQVTEWLNADLVMQYSNATNDQPNKGAGGPLIGLLVWPDTISAKEYLTPGGLRRSLMSTTEVDNPYFSVNKNQNHTVNNRITVNFGLTLMPFSWGYLKANIGTDSYTDQLRLLRHPESASGLSRNGILDEATDVTRNISTQTTLNFNRYALTDKLGISGLVGHAYIDNKSTISSMSGQDFLDPNFVSVNNTDLRFSRTAMAQNRRLSGFGQATLDYDNYLFLNVTGRNDWTSTIPTERNSFFYPGYNASFVFSDAFPAIGNVMSGKIRAAYAEVGRDAKPYAYRPSLEYKSTSNGGYGYGFTGPNFGLKPEFARSYEFGTELAFFDGRLGIDATIYRKQTKDQIVNDIRGSYATGFILFNLNGAETRNEGLELTVSGTPVLTSDFSWDVFANFGKARGTVISLPRDLPESYVSDTWLYGNVRNGVKPGLSTMALTGYFYLRNKNGDLLINPANGLPVRSDAISTFIDAGYDRQPDFTIGLTNTLRYKRVSLDFLLDIRKGGDVFNATEHYLTARGLSPRTLDREQPRVIKGVLRDGKENTDNPTPNNIVVIPAVQTGYYTSISEELFIEKDINWLRLRDVTLRYNLPAGFMTTRSASVFVSATDVFLITNYSGLDPIVNGNSAGVGGSGGAGIDYGNFPMPRGINFGVKVGF